MSPKTKRLLIKVPLFSVLILVAAVLISVVYAIVVTPILETMKSDNLILVGGELRLNSNGGMMRDEIIKYIVNLLFLGGGSVFSIKYINRLLNRFLDRKFPIKAFPQD